MSQDYEDIKEDFVKADAQESMNPLQQALQSFPLLDREAEVIGRALVALFDLERSLNILLSIWLSPRVTERKQGLSDKLLIYAPIGAKLDLAGECGLLDAKLIGIIRDLFQRRNDFAHPRPDPKRPGRIPEKDVRKFETSCRECMKPIIASAEKEIDNLVDAISHEWWDMFLKFFKALPEPVKESMRKHLPPKGSE